MEKRITRGKRALAASANLFDFRDAEFAPRLRGVLRALYLLFNEGYHGASPEAAVRVELCREALRLCTFLLDYPQTATPATYALGALMHFHAARLQSRVDEMGDIHAVLRGDRTRWDSNLTATGRRLMDHAASGDQITEYHIEAAIASLHAEAPSIEETNWPAVVALYDRLMDMRPSPVVALNRAIAKAQIHGPRQGLEELNGIAGREQLRAYPFYRAAIAEMHLELGDAETARREFARAAALSRNESERRFFERRMSACSDSA